MLNTGDHSLHKKGFTLIEIIVVLVIAGVIAALAIQKYNQIMEIRYARNARTNLLAINTAWQIHKLQYPNNPEVISNSACAWGNTDKINAGLGLHIVDTKYAYSGCSLEFGFNAIPYHAGEDTPYALVLRYNLALGPNNPFCVEFSYAGALRCPIGPVTVCNACTSWDPPALAPGDKWEY